MTVSGVEARPRVTLGISSCRNDDSVIRLCEELQAEPRARRTFHQVLVVDSLTTGDVPAYLAEQGLDSWIRYLGFARNLGAAGALNYRLLLAAGLRSDWLFALNHDGELNLDTIEALIELADGSSHGAVYPLRQISPDTFDLTGTRAAPLVPKRVSRERLERMHEPTLPVSWLSSNGALYSLRPVWDGVRPAVGLWHGFEDYAWGLALERHAYTQVMSTRVALEARYDYQTVPLPGTSVMVTDKPPWLFYYFARNLVLIGTRLFPGPLRALSSLVLITRELSLILLVRDRKIARLRMVGRGILDGLLGRTGLVVEPAAGLNVGNSSSPGSGR